MQPLRSGRKQDIAKKTRAKMVMEFKKHFTRGNLPPFDFGFAKKLQILVAKFKHQEQR